jgi:hypothetical protein
MQEDIVALAAVQRMQIAGRMYSCGYDCRHAAYCRDEGLGDARLQAGLKRFIMPALYMHILWTDFIDVRDRCSMAVDAVSRSSVE